MEVRPIYIPQPESSDLVETFESIRGAAKALSDAIKDAKSKGVSVKIEMADEDSHHLIQIIYSV